MDACVGSQDTYEFSLNRNLAMNEGSVQEDTRKASLPAFHLGWHVSTGARGSWSGWSVRLGGGGTCFWAFVTMEMAVPAGYVCKGRATT